MFRVEGRTDTRLSIFSTPYATTALLHYERMRRTGWDVVILDMNGRRHRPEELAASARAQPGTPA